MKFEWVANKVGGTDVFLYGVRHSLTERDSVKVIFVSFGSKILCLNVHLDDFYNNIHYSVIVEEGFLGEWTPDELVEHHVLRMGKIGRVSGLDEADVVKCANDSYVDIVRILDGVGICHTTVEEDEDSGKISPGILAYSKL